MSLLKNFSFDSELRSDGNIQSLFLDNEKQQIVYINIYDLVIVENQPFHLQSDEYINALAEDIKSNGLYSPLLVRKKENKFEIISGRHRYLAFKLLNSKEIPCIVTDKDDDEAVIAMINANLNQRLNMLPSELAFSFLIKSKVLKHMRKSDEKGFNVWEEVSKDTNFSEKKVRRIVKITELNKALIKAVDVGDITQVVYLEVSKLNKEEQEVLCNYFYINEISFKKLKAKFIQRLIFESEITYDKVDEIYKELYQKEKVKDEKIYFDEIYKNFDGRISKDIFDEILNYLTKQKYLKIKGI
ncbi:MAG: ParB/RepB/Spo0J family partition protein [Parvimonas sp.]|uniref:ParB/RepB/Spo0J family partition protein n=1 Tax=Parvimonas sp. TaxID=1944660 RepID=UPI0025FA4323|nr:ParB/RepB/Spo0J family partition protein [Parvimonas sp.]MCI5997039.1 ParB/RepB/Spo0J family partition protein [Parvimonas sp.]